MSAPQGKDPNRELMKAMGSETGRYDPEPPEQWRWDLAHGTSKMRARAWVKWKTTGHKDFETRSPYCVSEHGTPLTLEHAAVDLGWSIITTRAVFAELQTDGFVRLQKGGKIFNRADVPVSSEPPPEPTNAPVHNRWSPYLADSIRNLPPEKREVFNADEAEYWEWRNRGFAEMVASWRLMDEQVQNIMFDRAGIEKKRLPKTEREKPPVVQLSLLEVPSFVQTDDTNSPVELVQSAKPHRTRPKNGLHKPKAAAASLLPLDQDQELKRSVGQSVVKDRPTDPVPFPTKLNPEDARIDGVHALLADLLPHLHEDPSRSLCLQIADGLKGAPLAHLAALIKRKMRKIDSMGLCRDLAHEVGRAYVRDAAARQRAAEAREAYDAAALEQGRTTARDTLADPKSSEEEREIARQILSNWKTAGGQT